MRARALILIARDLLRNLAILVKRRLLTQGKRDISVTASEYERGMWTVVSTTKPWMAYSSLDEYVCHSGNNRTIDCVIDKKIVRLSLSEYYKFRRDNLVGLVSRFVENGEVIVEVGCGYGFNLFSLRSVSASFGTLVGLDISETA